MPSRSLVACALLLVSPLAAAQGNPPQTISRVGTPAPNAVTVQTAGTAPLAVTGSLSVSGAADTVGNAATFNANSVCATVLLTGQPGAGFALQAGTLSATLTPSVSEDATPATPGCTGGHYTATKFVVDAAGNTSATLVVTNPNSYTHYGVVTLSGSRCAQVCTTAYTSGSASGNLVASVAPSPPPAAGADVTDRAARVLGQLTDGASAITPAKTGQLPTALDGSGFLKVHEQGTATISGTVTGTVTANIGTSGSLALDASVTGLQVAQASTTSGQSGPLAQTATTTGAPTYVTGKTNPLSTTTAGALRVDGSGVTQPVSGTVTTTPPSNASTNLAQVAGTTTDVNSGNKSAGTLRVVLATDQPALTNKLLVTPDSVALPANQSVNTSQINGVTPLMGNGISGTGAQRVTIASDSTGQVTLASGTTTAVTQATAASLNATVIGSITNDGGAIGAGLQTLPAVARTGGSAVTAGRAEALQISTVAGGLMVEGPAANGATAAGNPLLAGAVGRATGAAPTQVTAGQASTLTTDLEHRLWTAPEHPNTWSCTVDAASSETQCIGLSGASLSYYITNAVFSASAAITFKVDSSTTANNACATAPAVVVPTLYFAANSGAPLNFKQPIKVTANSALCCKPSGASGSCILTGYVAP